jgi:hypothetical protein
MGSSGKLNAGFPAVRCTLQTPFPPTPKPQTALPALSDTDRRAGDTPQRLLTIVISVLPRKRKTSPPTPSDISSKVGITTPPPAFSPEPRKRGGGGGGGGVAGPPRTCDVSRAGRGRKWLIEGVRCSSFRLHSNRTNF